MSNPLLTASDLPAYHSIQAEHIEPAIDHLLAENRAAIADLLADCTSPPTWTTLIQPLEELEDRLSRAWSPVNHLHSVCDSEALRSAYNACLPKLSAYYTELGQHEGLYQAYQHIATGPEYTTLNPAQRKVIDNALRDFRLSGIALPATQRERYKTITKVLCRKAKKGCCIFILFLLRYTLY